MIQRYSHKPVADIWSLAHKYELWAKIETSFLNSFLKWWYGSNEPFKTPKITNRAIATILRYESNTKHDVAAFIQWFERYISKQDKQAARYVHYGLTSSDIVDTAFSMQIAETNKQIIKLCKRLQTAINNRKKQCAGITILGRTHGQAAEKFFLNQKLENYNAAITQNLPSTEPGGRIRGSIGDCKYFSTTVSENTLKQLGLKEGLIDGQIIHRSVYAKVMFEWALLASTLEKIATDLRLLSHDGVNEVSESFTRGQVGSSSMPHKRNPINCENLCGIARVIRGYQSTTMQNIPLWNERDISHSSAERIIFPDAAESLAYMLVKLTEVFRNLHVDRDKIEKNLDRNSMKINSQARMLALIHAGKTRSAAHKLIQNATI